MSSFGDYATIRYLASKEFESGGVPDPTEQTPTSQREQFEQAARALGCDDDPAHLDEALKKVARRKPLTDQPLAQKKPKDTGK